MPRGSSAATRTAARGRRRAIRAGSDTAAVVGQVTQLVATNETLKRENAELLAVNQQLRVSVHGFDPGLIRVIDPPLA